MRFGWVGEKIPKVVSAAPRSFDSCAAKGRTLAQDDCARPGACGLRVMEGGGCWVTLLKSEG